MKKQLDWRITVEKVTNGYIVSHLEEIENRDVVKEEKVTFTENDLVDADDDLEAVRDMLYWIIDHFAIKNGKHQKKNIRIEIVDGEDYINSEAPTDIPVKDSDEKLPWE